MVRETIDCSGGDQLRADEHGIDALVRAGGVAAEALDPDVDRVGRGHDRTRADGKGADRNPRAVMHAVDLLDAEPVHQPVLDHRRRARTALLGRLEDHDRVAGEIPGLGQIPRCTQKHRGVAVMAAGVHLALRLGGVGQIGCLLDRQRVHVGAKPDHLDFALAGLLALDDADDAGAAEAGRDLVAAELAQAIRHECCGAVHVVEQFGVFMDIAAPGLDIGLQIGDAVDDGHGNSRTSVWNALSCLACKGRSTQWP